MSNKLLPLAATALFVIAGVLLSLFVNPFLGWLILIAVLLGFMGAGRLRRLLLLAWAYFAVDSIVRIYIGGNMFVQHIDEALYVGLVAILIANIAINKTNLSQYGFSRFLKLAVPLLAFIIFSAVLNKAVGLRLIHFLKAYTFFIPFFLIAVLSKKSGDARRILKIGIVFYLFQVVMNLGWKLGINPIKHRLWWSPMDFAAGTIGGCNSVAYLTMMLLMVIASYFLLRGRKKIMPWLLLAMVCVVQFYFTYTMHAYYLFAIVGGVYYLLYAKRPRERIIPVVAVLFLGVFLLVAAGPAPKYGSRGISGFELPKVADLVSGEYVKQNWRRAKDGPKWESYKRSFVELPSSNQGNWFIGVGPGRFMTTPARTRPTAITYKYIGDWYLSVSGQQERSGHSIALNPLIGVCGLFGELGIVGFLLYMIIYGYLAARILSQLRRGMYRDFYERIMAMAFVPSIILFLSINFLIDFFANPFFISTLWIWGGIMWNPDESQNTAALKPNKSHRTNQYINRGP